MQQHEDWRNGSSLPGIAPAVIVIGIGVLFLLNNLNIYFLHDIWRFWPGILIAVGLVRLVDSPGSNGKLQGGVLVVVGALFLANNLGFLQLSWRDSWPLVLIGAGLLMLWHRLTPATFVTPDAPAGHEGTLNEYAIFGGVERRVTTDDFRGGQVSAVFGGVDIDLRRAGMRGDSAVIEVNTTFGGVDMKIPPTWIAIPQVAAFFGGVGNKTAQPAPDAPGVKRLYIKGAAFFGGVDIKN